MEINIIDTIERGAEKQVIQALEAANGADVTVNINSLGGDVKETLGICNRLAAYPGKVIANIMGIAASCAAWLPVYCNEVHMRKNARMMFHKASGAPTKGTADGLRKAADDLDSINTMIAGIAKDKTGLSVDAVLNHMSKAIYWDAETAHRLGFVDEIVDSNAMSFQNLAGFENLPQELTRGVRNMEEGKGSVGMGTGARVRSAIRQKQDQGWSLEEIGRRVDRSASTLSSILAEEIANPPESLFRDIRALPANPPGGPRNELLIAREMNERMKIRIERDRLMRKSGA